MNYLFALFWYASALISVIISYFASRLSIIYFDKKWKVATEEDEKMAEQENA